MPRRTVDEFYRAWLGRDLDGLARVLDDDVRWSSPTTLPGGGVRRGRRAVLEQAALIFERFPSVVVERMATTVVGEWATVRGRYQTMEGRRVDFVDRIRVKDGRIAALRANMRADQVRSVVPDHPRP
jgi:ketosteroid isomerase-like protein